MSYDSNGNYDPFGVKTWDEFVGQAKLKERLRTHIDAALSRDEVIDHTLLLAPPGSGKTTLAKLIAYANNVPFESFMMPIKPAVLRRIVQTMEGVILLDEVHRLPRSQQENLLPLIQDGYIQLDNGAQIEASPMLKVIAATTEPDKVITPLIDRFPIRPHFEEYTDDELAEIVNRMAWRNAIELTDEQARIYGAATGGVPRNAKQVVVMMRDMNQTDPDTVLPMVGLTRDGLNQMHIGYLQALYDVGHIAGLEVISSYLKLPKATIIDLERLLVRRKFIEYSPSGRQLTVLGAKKLKESYV